MIHISVVSNVILSHGSVNFKYFLFQEDKFQFNSVVKYLILISRAEQICIPAPLFPFDFSCYEVQAIKFEGF